MSLILNRLRPDRAISPQMYGGLFRSLLDIRGSSALELPASMRASIVAENDRPENFFPQHTVLFSLAVTLGASVGNTSHVGIRNLVGSGYLATVWLAVNNETGANAIFNVGFLFPSNGSLTTSGQVPPSDSRLTTFAPALFAISFAGASVSNAVQRVSLLAGDNSGPYGPWVMAPNSDLFVTPSALNQAVSASLWGYARPLRAVQLQR